MSSCGGSCSYIDGSDSSALASRLSAVRHQQSNISVTPLVSPLLNYRVSSSEFKVKEFEKKAQ